MRRDLDYASLVPVTAGPYHGEVTPELASEEAKLSKQLADVQAREAELMKKVETERKVGKA